MQPAMEEIGDNKVHVVFVGRKPGIYFTYKDVLEQVNHFSGSFHGSYDSYDDSEEAYIEYYFFHDLDPGFVGAQLHSNVKMTKNGERIATVPTSLAVDTSHAQFISQECMEKLLRKLCLIVKVGQPVFRLHHVITVNSVQYRRYCASVDMGTLGDPIVSVEKFAKDDYAATEDAAVLLAEELCDHTGKQIRDFNFYKVQKLEAKVAALKDDNVKLKMQLAILKKSKRPKCSGEHSL